MKHAFLNVIINLIKISLAYVCKYVCRDVSIRDRVLDVCDHTIEIVVAQMACDPRKGE